MVVMLNNDFIIYKFFTKTTWIFKWQLQNNRFTEHKYFLEKDCKTKAIKILC